MIKLKLISSDRSSDFEKEVAEFWAAHECSGTSYCFTGRCHTAYISYTIKKVTKKAKKKVVKKK